MKTGVLLITHGGYGRPMLETAEGLVGSIPAALVEVPRGMGREELREVIIGALREHEQGKGLLLLTDLCGATPANLCLSLMGEHPGSEMLTGLNIAMLIKLSTCDLSQPAAELAGELRRTAQRSIQLGSELARRGEPGGT